MSTWKRYVSFKVEVGQTRSDFYTAIRSLMLDQGWRIHYEDAVNFVIDWIPPIGESIGNGLAFQVFRMRFTTTTLDFTVYIRSITLSQKKVFRIWSSTSGGSTFNATINYGGVGKTFSGPSGSSVDAKTQSIYNALIASSDAEVQKYDYTYLGTGDVLGTDDRIVATEKIAGQGAVLTSGSGASIQRMQFAVEPNTNLTTPFSDTETLFRVRSISTDYTNGFACFIEIRSRSVLLATETTAAMFGPIFASYIDNAEALAQTPTGSVPMELFIGSLEGVVTGSTTGLNTSNSGYTSTGTPINFFTTHWHGLTYGDPYFQYPVVSGYVWKLTKGGENSKNWADLLGYSGFTSNRFSLNVSTSVMGLKVTSGALTSLSAVIEMGNIMVSIENTSVSFNDSAQLKEAKYIMKDLFGVFKQVANKVLLLYKDQTINRTLATSINNSQSTLEISSTAGFASAGAVYVDNEIIEYAGIVGNTLTGCSRGRYGTSADVHASGAQVYPALWFVRVNGAALCAGYTKPTS